MTNREIVAVALKCFVIYILVNLLIQLPLFSHSISTWTELLGDKEPTGMPYLIAIFIMVIVLAILLSWAIWKLSNKVAGDMTAGESDETRLSSEVTHIILAGIGLLLLVPALLELPNYIWYAYVEVSGYPEKTDGLSLKTVFSTMAVLGEIIIGLTLLVKTSAWRGILLHLRTAGAEK